MNETEQYRIKMYGYYMYRIYRYVATTDNIHVHTICMIPTIDVYTVDTTMTATRDTHTGVPSKPSKAVAGAYTVIPVYMIWNR